MAEQKYLCDRCTRYPCSENETKLMTLCPAYAPKPKPTTNADRIRGMNDEELAEFIAGIYTIERDAWGDYDPCTVVAHCVKIRDEDMLDWLQSPAGEENDVQS